jgi:hypothetical protein
MYGLTSVYNSVYTIPIDETVIEGSIYINNYANFAIYNFYYKDN